MYPFWGFETHLTPKAVLRSETSKKKVYWDCDFVTTIMKN